MPPELPEVENVKLGLSKLLSKGIRNHKLTLFRKDLRFPFPERLAEKLQGQALLSIGRRAKYLIFEFEQYWMISHLGMTGSWRSLERTENHDHMQMEFENGPTIVFNDPRRFGFITLFLRSEVPSHFEGLGPEPLEKDFHAEYLFQASRKKNTPIKSFLLDQKTVAGLGNIYVCEALHRAGVSPRRKAGRTTMKESEKLVVAIRKILAEAIKAGGSTIRDYRNAEGDAGAFQLRFKVYGRAGLSCPKCKTEIKILRQAGRSSFWCPQCQK
jgi:formamidopyrimidine-DNA glycosylase